MRLTTLPLTRELTGYFFSISSQGEVSFCFRPSAIFSRSRSMFRILTSTSSPIFTISLGWFTRPQLMSVMCSRPSRPPRSMNAPKSAMLVTVPRTMSPSFTWPSSLDFAASRSSSMSLRRLMTMFLRSSSIFRIDARIVRPT